MSTARNRTAHEQRDQYDEAISLREYFEVRLAALETLVMARMDAMQLASETRRTALDTRLEQMNEIRGQLATQRADFVTTDRLESLLVTGQSERKTFTDKISSLEAQQIASATLAREQTQKDLALLRDRMENDFKTVNADIRSLRESRSTTQGSAITSREYVTYGIAIVAIVATLLSRFLH